MDGFRAYRVNLIKERVVLSPARHIGSRIPARGCCDDFCLQRKPIEINFHS